MTIEADPAQVREIRGVLSRLTAAWREGRFDELEGLLHEKVVFVPPGFSARLEGRSPCGESYRQFMTAAKVIEYVESDHTIDVWGTSAVASYRFEMTWEMANQLHRDAGHDLLVFVREDGRWQIVWRMLVPLAS